MTRFIGTSAESEAATTETDFGCNRKSDAPVQKGRRWSPGVAFDLLAALLNMPMNVRSIQHIDSFFFEDLSEHKLSMS